jgi:hypothetical protein
MPAYSDITNALDALAATGFEMNTAWEKAHHLAQTHEGVRAYDALHAFCHRIENDLSNAAYWDRRAGTAFGENGHTAELASLRDFLRTA